MARGRQQKWICMDCKGEFSVQGKAPRFCCSCGSANIGRAPSYDLAMNFDQKRKELAEICDGLNPAFEEAMRLKEQYDKNMAYWKQQRRRGYITAEEYEDLAARFIGYAPKLKP